MIGTNPPDRTGRGMATAVTTVNKERMYAITIRTKTPMGKKLELNRYHKMREHKLLFTLLGMDPRALEANRQAPSRCTTSATCLL